MGAREMLERLVQARINKHHGGISNYGYDEALKSLATMVRGMKKECICHPSNLWKCDCGAAAYERAVTDIANAIEGEKK